MNFELKQEHKLIQKTARDFATNELLPGVLDRDENKIWPKEAVSKMGDLGFLGIMVSNPTSFRQGSSLLSNIGGSSKLLRGI